MATFSTDLPRYSAVFDPHQFNPASVSASLKKILTLSTGEIEGSLISAQWQIRIHHGCSRGRAGLTEDYYIAEGQV